MKVAIITPYHREPADVLLRCHASVAAQHYPATHFLIADGFPRDELDRPGVRHIVMPRAHGNNGNTPRAAGGLCALAEGYDVITYLDADNWYDADHVAEIVGTIARTGVDVICAPRRIWLADGRLCPFEDEDVTARNTADTSSVALCGRGLQLVPVWGLMPNSLSPICDRVVMAAIAELGLEVAWTARRSVNYESRWPDHYAALGSPPPADAHSTDWDRVEQGYAPARLIERMGFDPFAGDGPRRATHKPIGLVPVEV